MDGVKEYLKIRQGELAPNVSLQLTLAFASANANVPEVERLSSRETRAEEREQRDAAVVQRVRRSMDK
jgi:hypothetical protein